MCPGPAAAADHQQPPASLPFPRSFWVVPNRLLAGCYPGALDLGEAEAKLAALVTAGVRCVINLVEEGEHGHQGQLLRPYADMLSQAARAQGVNVTYARIPIRDQDVPSTETMQLILDAIDVAMGRGRMVYLHCWGGRGRTGTVVGCWLARHRVAQGDRALARLQELRQPAEDAAIPAPDTEAQREMVRGWKRGQ